MSVEEHYGRGAFAERYRAGADQLHARGAEATAELAELAGLEAGERVLDVGAGVGGPARFLAERYGVEVVGLDLTPGFVEVARRLTDEAGLADRVRFVEGDATALPFEAEAFDVVWTQHAAMNMPDKAAVYAEARRVLRPGGRLALYDVLAGDGRAPEYPLPWASRADQSFLVGTDELRGLLAAAGFRVVEWRDVTEAGRAWSVARTAEERSPPFVNLARAFEEGRLGLVQAVAVPA